MVYAYATIARNEDGSKEVVPLYVGADPVLAKQRADSAVSDGAESAVVKELGVGTIYHSRSKD